MERNPSEKGGRRLNQPEEAGLKITGAAPRVKKDFMARDMKAGVGAASWKHR
jgi:hypothetical protein